MGYLISQIVFCLLIAGIIGALIGYLLKQLLGTKMVQKVDAMWSDKVRVLTRDLDAERTETKLQAQKTQDAERTGAETTNRLTAAQKELLTAKEKVSAVEGDLARKASSFAALEAANKDWKIQLEASAKKAADLEAVITDKDVSLQNLESELAGAVKVSDAKDLHIQTLDAEIGELAPLKDQLAVASKAVGDWEGRFKALEKAKGGEVAGWKSRIGELEPLLAKVKDWEVRHSSMLNAKDAALAKLTSTVAALEPLKDRAAAVAKENCTLSAKVRELELAASAVTVEKNAIIGGFETREKVEHETLVTSPRARV